jgi:hypothetical protein
MEASRKMFNKAIFISYTLQLNYYSVIVKLQKCCWKINTVKPALRGHLWDKEKVFL